MKQNTPANRILLVLFIGVLMGALDIAIVGPALPAIQADFGVNERTLTWLFTIYVLFNLIGTPLMAKLSDAYGRRNVYVADVALFAAGSLLVALAPSFELLLAGRAIQGFGAGGIFPVASAVIGDTFPPEKRGSALGMIGAVFGVSFIIGPILGGVILQFLNWHWLFLLNLPVAVLVFVLSYRTLPQHRRATRRPFDGAGMVVLGVLLASLTYGINRINTAQLGRSLLSLDVWPFLLAAVALVPVFIRIERQAADPVLRLGLFRSRQVALTCVLSAGAGVGEASLVFMPALAVAALGVTEASASFLLVPVVAALAIGSPVVGKMLDKVGSRRVILVGTTLLALGMVMLSQLAGHTLTFILSGAVTGAGLIALLGAPIRYIMLNEAPPSERASAQGIITLFTSVGQLVSGALVGAVAASQGGGMAGYTAAYLFIGVLSLLLILTATRLKGRREELATVQRNEAMTRNAETARAGGH